jgi:thiol-disulfide isomerase/thioredoxin
MGRVKIIKDPSQIIPASDAKLQINMFFAPWCGHCQAMKPSFVELADKYPGVDFALVENTVMQQHPEADSFGVRGFPHVAAYLGKKPLGTHVGNQGMEKLNEFISKMVSMAKK